VVSNNAPNDVKPEPSSPGSGVVTPPEHLEYVLEILAIQAGAAIDYIQAATAQVALELQPDR
jgi:hypothetical protein